MFIELLPPRPAPPPLNPHRPQNTAQDDTQNVLPPHLRARDFLSQFSPLSLSPSPPPFSHPQLEVSPSPSNGPRRTRTERPPVGGAPPPPPSAARPPPAPGERRRSATRPYCFEKEYFVVARSSSLGCVRDPPSPPHPPRARFCADPCVCCRYISLVCFLSYMDDAK